ncbi:hypothetical protein [Nocardia sp. NPDC005998]|uniref:hypothetical protein n=1 Tax=Nocardia sp. NPDC005998 TaxID=3156894 RepID=UPI0033B4F8F9
MSNHVIGAGLFEMTLDDGRLPVQVQVSRNLWSRLEPSEVSAAAMTGYWVAALYHDAPITRTGNYTALTARLPRRAELITLLNARSLAEYEALERVLYWHEEFTAHGPVTDFGFPSMSVTAGLGRISAITIDPRWAARTEPSYIGYDIIACANRIRQWRPKVPDEGSWAHRTDDELAQEVREYYASLTRNR